ncbi:MAG: hypothetical protein RL386_1794 [Bacteroidota bacterium]
MRIFVLLTLAALATCCELLSGFENTEIPPSEVEVALPIVNSTVAIGELLEGFERVADAISMDSAGILHFKYQGDLITRSGEEIFSRIGAALPPLIPLLADNLTLPLILPAGAVLEKVDLKAGNFSFYAENPNRDPVQVRLTLPDLRRQDKPFTLEFSLPGYSGTGPRPSTTNSAAPASLAGYRVLPANQAIRLQYQALSPKGERLQLSPFVVQLTGLAFSYFEGYLGRLLYEGEKDSVQIDFFDTRYIQGNIRFAEPKVSFFFENSIGVPTLAIVNTFDIVNVRGQRMAVQGPAVQSGIPFPFPGLNEVGQSKQKIFDFTKENSNIRELMASGPVAVVYDVDALTHPSGNNTERGFVTDKSFYRVSATVDLPFIGQASAFEVDQDFSLELSDFASARKVALRLITDNDIPLDLDVQGYFLNSNGQVVDSLLPAPERLVRGALVGADGLPLSKSQKVTEALFEDERLKRILNAAQLRIKVALSTDSNQGKDVKILSGQRLQLRLSARAVL